MPDPAARRLPNTAEAELRLNGRLLYGLQQRSEGDLTPIKAAAVIESLRSLADGLEETCLDRQAGEVLAEVDVSMEVQNDDPANVG